MNFFTSTFCLRSSILLACVALAGVAPGCAAQSDVPRDNEDLAESSDALTVNEAVGIWRSGPFHIDSVTGKTLHAELHVYRDRTFVLTYTQCVRAAAPAQCDTLSRSAAASLPSSVRGPAAAEGTWHRKLRVEWESEFLRIWDKRSDGFGPHFYRALVLESADTQPLRLFHKRENAEDQRVGALVRTKGSNDAGWTMTQVSSSPNPSL